MISSSSFDILTHLSPICFVSGLALAVFMCCEKKRRKKKVVSVADAESREESKTVAGDFDKTVIDVTEASVDNECQLFSSKEPATKVVVVGNLSIGMPNEFDKPTSTGSSSYGPQIPLISANGSSMKDLPLQLTSYKESGSIKTWPFSPVPVSQTTKSDSSRTREKKSEGSKRSKGSKKEKRSKKSKGSKKSKDEDVSAFKSAKEAKEIGDESGNSVSVTFSNEVQTFFQKSDPLSK